MLLDHIIADRYGCPLAGIDCLTTPVRGGYVVGMRRDDARARAGRGRAPSRAMIDPGELRRILDGVAPLGRRAAGSRRPARRPRRAPPADAASLDGHQLALFLEGARVTALLSLAAFAIAMPLGMLLAAARMGAGRMRAGVRAVAYVELLRGTPVLLQLYVLYFGLAPVLKLGPLTAATAGPGPELRGVRGGGVPGGLDGDAARSDRGGGGARTRPLADASLRDAAAGHAHGAARR